MDSIVNQYIAQDGPLSVDHLRRQAQSSPTEILRVFQPIRLPPQASAARAYDDDVTACSDAPVQMALPFAKDRIVSQSQTQENALPPSRWQFVRTLSGKLHAKAIARFKHLQSPVSETKQNVMRTDTQALHNSCSHDKHVTATLRKSACQSDLGREITTCFQQDKLPGLSSDTSTDNDTDSISTLSLNESCTPIVKTAEEKKAEQLVRSDDSSLLDLKEQQVYFSYQATCNHPDVARHQYRIRLGNLYESAGLVLSSYYLDPIDLTEDEFVDLVCSQGNATSDWLDEHARKITNRRIQLEIRSNHDLRNIGILPYMLPDDFLEIYPLLDASEQMHFVKAYREIAERLAPFEETLWLSDDEKVQYRRMGVLDKAAFIGLRRAKEAELSSDETDLAAAYVNKILTSDDGVNIGNLLSKCTDKRSNDVRSSEVDSACNHTRTFSFATYNDTNSTAVELPPAALAGESDCQVADRDAEMVRDSVVAQQIQKTCSSKERTNSSPECSNRTLKVDMCYVKYLESKYKYPLESKTLDEHTVQIKQEDLTAAENYIRGIQRVREFERRESWTNIFRHSRATKSRRRNFSQVSAESEDIRGTIKCLLSDKKPRTLRKTLSRFLGSKKSRMSLHAEYRHDACMV